MRGDGDEQGAGRVDPGSQSRLPHCSTRPQTQAEIAQPRLCQSRTRRTGEVGAEVIERDRVCKRDQRRAHAGQEHDDERQGEEAVREGEGHGCDGRRDRRNDQRTLGAQATISDVAPERSRHEPCERGEGERHADLGGGEPANLEDDRQKRQQGGFGSADEREQHLDAAKLHG